MKKWIFAILLMGATSPVWAMSDADCLFGDCLKYGWEIETYRGGPRTVVECENEDCSQFGWSEYRGRRQVAYTQCLYNDCFQFGWETFQPPFFDRKVAEVRCEADSEGVYDCLKSGWITHIRGGRSFRAECVGSDCRSLGWDIFYPNGQIELVRCKNQSCFNEGWTLNP